jgi:DNA-binding protein H-NS
MNLVLTCVTTEPKKSVAQRNRESADKYRKMSKYRGLARAEGITDDTKIEEYAQKLYKELQDQQARKASKSSSDNVDLKESDQNVENESLEEKVPKVSEAGSMSLGGDDAGVGRLLASSRFRDSLN